MVKAVRFFIYFALSFAWPAYALSPLFSSEDPLDITIKTSMDFKAYYDGEREKGNDQFPAEIRYEFEGKPIISKVQIAPRGRSRLADCHFSPFKLIFDGTNNGPLFAGVGKSIKFVARCGRLPNLAEDERMLTKEILIYKVVEATGIPSFKVRRVNVHYENEQGWVTGHDKAFIIENKKLLLARDHRFVRSLTDEEMRQVGLSENTNPQLDPHLRALHELVQNMIQNYDWNDGVFGKFQNVEAVFNRDGKVVMIPYDFDRTAFVGHENDLREGSVRYFSKYFENHCQDAVRRSATRTLLARKEIVLKTIFDFPLLSEDSKTQLFEHITNYFEALQTLR